MNFNNPWNNNFRGHDRGRGWHGNRFGWRPPPRYGVPLPPPSVPYWNNQYNYRAPLPMQFNPRFPFQPINPDRPFRSPPPIRKVPSPPHSPLPGTEEYTLRDIQQKSELIKKQLNLIGECGELETNIPDVSKPAVQSTPVVSESVKTPPVTSTPPPPKLVTTKMKPVRNQSYNVQEIYDKIMYHITNLSHGKKMNLINTASAGYDEAIKQIQKKERLELSRALRDMCNQNMEDSTYVINSIIPDIGIKLEDLPAEVIAELSSTLNLNEDVLPDESSIDPELLFKQAEDMLSMDFLDILGDNSEPALKSPPAPFDEDLSQAALSLVAQPPPPPPLEPTVFPPCDNTEPIICTPYDNTEPVISTPIKRKVSTIKSTEQGGSDMADFAHLPGIVPLSYHLDSSLHRVGNDAGFSKATSLEESYNQFVSDIEAMSKETPSVSETPLMVRPPPDKSVDASPHTTASSFGLDLLPSDFKLSSSYLNFSSNASGAKEKAEEEARKISSPQVAVSPAISTENIMSAPAASENMCSLIKEKTDKVKMQYEEELKKTEISNLAQPKHNLSARSSQLEVKQDIDSRLHDHQRSSQTNNLLTTRTLQQSIHTSVPLLEKHHTTVKQGSPQIESSQRHHGHPSPLVLPTQQKLDNKSHVPQLPLKHDPIVSQSGNAQADNLTVKQKSSVSSPHQLPLNQNVRNNRESPKVSSSPKHSDCSIEKIDHRLPDPASSSSITNRSHSTTDSLRRENKVDLWLSKDRHCSSSPKEALSEHRTMSLDERLRLELGINSNNKQSGNDDNHRKRERHKDRYRQSDQEHRSSRGEKVKYRVRVQYSAPSPTPPDPLSYISPLSDLDQVDSSRRISKSGSIDNFRERKNTDEVRKCDNSIKRSTEDVKTMAKKGDSTLTRETSNRGIKSQVSHAMPSKSLDSKHELPKTSNKRNDESKSVVEKHTQDNSIKTVSRSNAEEVQTTAKKVQQHLKLNSETGRTGIQETNKSCSNHEESIKRHFSESTKRLEGNVASEKKCASNSKTSETALPQKDCDNHLNLKQSSREESPLRSKKSTLQKAGTEQRSKSKEKDLSKRENKSGLESPLASKKTELQSAVTDQHSKSKEKECLKRENKNNSEGHKESPLVSNKKTLQDVATEQNVKSKEKGSSTKQYSKSEQTNNSYQHKESTRVSKESSSQNVISEESSKSKEKEFSKVCSRKDNKRITEDNKDLSLMSKKSSLPAVEGPKSNVKDSSVKVYSEKEDKSTPDVPIASPLTSKESSLQNVLTEQTEPEEKISSTKVCPNTTEDDKGSPLVSKESSVQNVVTEQKSESKENISSINVCPQNGNKCTTEDAEGSLLISKESSVQNVVTEQKSESKENISFTSVCPQNENKSTTLNDKGSLLARKESSTQNVVTEQRSESKGNECLEGNNKTDSETVRKASSAEVVVGAKILETQIPKKTGIAGDVNKEASAGKEITQNDEIKPELDKSPNCYKETVQVNLEEVKGTSLQSCSHEAEVVNKKIEVDEKRKEEVLMQHKPEVSSESYTSIMEEEKGMKDTATVQRDDHKDVTSVGVLNTDEEKENTRDVTDLQEVSNKKDLRSHSPENVLEEKPLGHNHEQIEPKEQQEIPTQANFKEQTPEDGVKNSKKAVGNVNKPSAETEAFSDENEGSKNKGHYLNKKNLLDNEGKHTQTQGICSKPVEDNLKVIAEPEECDNKEDGKINENSINADESIQNDTAVEDGVSKNIMDKQTTLDEEKSVVLGTSLVTPSVKRSHVERRSKNKTKVKKCDSDAAGCLDSKNVNAFNTQEEKQNNSEKNIGDIAVKRGKISQQKFEELPHRPKRKRSSHDEKVSPLMLVKKKSNPEESKNTTVRSDIFEELESMSKQKSFCTEEVCDSVKESSKSVENVKKNSKRNRDRPCPASKKRFPPNNDHLSSKIEEDHKKSKTAVIDEVTQKIYERYVSKPETVSVETQTKKTVFFTAITQTDKCCNRNKSSQTEVSVTDQSCQTSFACEKCGEYEARLKYKDDIIKELLRIDTEIRSLLARRESLCHEVPVEEDITADPESSILTTPRYEATDVCVTRVGEGESGDAKKENLSSVPASPVAKRRRRKRKVSQMTDDTSISSSPQLLNTEAQQLEDKNMLLEDTPLDVRMMQCRKRRKSRSIKQLDSAVEDPPKLQQKSQDPKPTEKQQKSVDRKFYSGCKVSLTRYTVEGLKQLRDDICKGDKKVDHSEQIDALNKELQSVSEFIIKEVDKSQAGCSCLEDDFSVLFEGITGIVLVIKAVGNTILAATDKGKLLCYSLSGKLLHVFDASRLPITSVCVLKTKSDEKFIYVGSLDATMTIYNYTSKKLVSTVNLDERVQCMEISWGYVFLGSDRGYLIRYNISDGKVEFTEKISDHNVLVVKATREGARKVLLVATRNSAVSVRDAMSGLHMRNMETPFFPTVYTLLLENNLVYCGTSQHDILVYTFEDGQLIRQHEAAKSKGVVCMQIVNSILFAGCYNGNIYVYDTKSNEYLGSMQGPGGLLLCMHILDDKIFVGTKTNNFKAWRIPEKFLGSR